MTKKQPQGECWVCRREIKKYLQRHHVVKLKEDPDLTVDLCRGCHYLVTQLARRKFLPDFRKVADLITLARFNAGLLDAETILRYSYTPPESEVKE